MNKTHKIVYAAMTGAIAFILIKLTSFPIIPSAGYLKMELSEVPLLLLSAAVSPWVGLCAAIVRSGLRFLSGSNIYGVVSDFLFATLFIVTFGAVMRRRSGWKPILQASAASVAVRLVFCVPANLIILKLQYGQSPSEVMAMMLPFLLPFNFLKGTISIACFCPVYLRMRSYFLHTQSMAAPGKTKTTARPKEREVL